MQALATIEALEVRLGRAFLEEERARAEAILVDVSAIALNETSGGWTAQTVPADVSAVVLSAALRAFKNPDGYIDQNIGSFSAKVHHTQFSSGIFTRPELAILHRNSHKPGFGAFGFTTVSRWRDDSSREIDQWEVAPYGSPVNYLEVDGWH